MKFNFGKYKDLEDFDAPYNYLTWVHQNVKWFQLSEKALEKIKTMKEELKQINKFNNFSGYQMDDFDSIGYSKRAKPIPDSYEQTKTKPPLWSWD